MTMSKKEGAPKPPKKEKPYIVLLGTHEDLWRDDRTNRYRAEKIAFGTYKSAITRVNEYTATNEADDRDDEYADPILLRMFPAPESDTDKVLNLQFPYVVVSKKHNNTLYAWSPLPASELNIGPSDYYRITRCRKNQLEDTVRAAIENSEYVRGQEGVFVGVELQWEEQVEQSKKESKDKYLDEKIKDILGGR